ncbi:globin [Oesophagostomum dentatum]|uniref:Globin n=1 Tax=Oesophagostomum dentatum TaxID=61180 RepID=A0A0B1SVG8_OESDE|nr:globin [Oesophagostomum dentatum]
MARQLSITEASSSQETSPKKGQQLCLSYKHKKILRSTFTQMNSGGAFLKLMEQVFRRLEAKYPDIRSIFLTTAFVNSLSRERSSPPLVRTEHDHCKCLVALFEKIMDSLNETDNQLLLIRQYGEKHAQMKDSGMSASMIEHFGEIAVAVIASQDYIKYNHDAVKAWRLLLAYVTDEMMVGFERLSRIS